MPQRCGGDSRSLLDVPALLPLPAAVACHDEWLRLYENLSADPGFNVLFSQQGHLTPASHSHLSINGLHLQANVNQMSIS